MTILDTSSEFGHHVAERLERESLIWLTTVGGKTSTPAPSVVWFLWNERDFLLLSEPNKPKLRNIEVYPRVALNLQSIDGGDVAVFAGDARFDPDGFEADEWDAYARKYESLMSRLGHTPDSFVQVWSELIRVTPDKVRGFL